MNLRRRIVERSSEFLLFTVTPPRQSTSPQRAQQIADAALERLRPLALFSHDMRISGYHFAKPSH